MNISQKRALLVYGDSIFLTGVSDTLRLRGDLTIAALPPQADFSAVLALHPDLILVDAQQFTPAQTEQLMATFPDGHCPVILHLNADSQRLTVFFQPRIPCRQF
jgi:hypothetical protein